MKSMRSLLFSLAVAASFLLYSGCGKKAPAPAAPKPPTVQTLTLTEQDIPIYREVIGTLDGFINSRIRARVQGYLLEQPYQDGSYVEAGSILFQIDPQPYQIEVQKAEATVAEAIAQEVKAEIDVERNQELILANAVSQKQLDNSIQSLQAASAQVMAARANLNQAKLNLSYCTVITSVSGLAGRSSVDTGDLITPNDLLTTVSTLDPIQFIFNIPEQYFLNQAENVRRLFDKPLDERPDSLELILSNGETWPHKGRLQYIDRAVQESTGQIAIYSLFPNPDQLLRPGEFARVRTVVRHLKDAIAIPQRALVEVQGTFQVYTVTSDNKAKMVNVTLGDYVGSQVVVLSGLSKGDVLLVEGQQKVRDGSPVSPTPWKGDSDDSKKGGSADESESSSSDASTDHS